MKTLRMMFLLATFVVALFQIDGVAIPDCPSACYEVHMEMTDAY